MITISCSAFWQEVHLKFPLIIFSNKFLTILAFFLVILQVLLLQRNMKFDIYRASFAIIVISLISLVIGINYIANGQAPLLIDVVNYAWLPLSLLAYGFRLSINIRETEKLLIILIVPQLILGIIQYMLRRTIVPIMSSDGRSFVDTIFYLNGASSNDPAYLGLGANVRSFGFTSSGLVLGVFALVILSISLNSQYLSKVSKVILGLVSGVTIYMTITRNIYVTAVFLLAMSLFTKRNFYRFPLRIVYFILMILSAVGVFLGSFLNKISESLQTYNVYTFSVRFSFIQTSLKSLNSFSKVLFGGQIRPTIDLPIDNSFIAMLVDKGLIFCIVAFVSLIVLFNFLCSHKSIELKPFILVLLALSITGFTNNVSSVMGVIMLITVMMANGIEREKIDN